MSRADGRHPIGEDKECLSRGAIRILIFFKKIITTIRLLSLSLYYMYTRDNGVPIGLFRQFRLDLETCFDVLAVRSEVQTQG